MTGYNKNLIEKYEKAAERVAGHYSQLPSVVSVVVGGSLARRFTDVISDIEMYVYYKKSIPSKSEIRNILKKLNATLTRSKKLHWYHPAWGYHTFFKFGDIKFELGYRDIDSIKERMRKFKGEFALPKHGIHDAPFGHYESGVAACIVECQPIYDPKGEIKDLKKYLSDYKSSKLRRETFNYYIKDAKVLSLAKIKYAVKRNDIYNFHACIARAIRSLVISLFALNNHYYPGDKWNQR